MAAHKPVEWANALLARFEEQLPCRSGPANSTGRRTARQIEQALVAISRCRLSLVLNGLTRALHAVGEMRARNHHHLQINAATPATHGGSHSLASVHQVERNCLDSQLLLLHALLHVLASGPSGLEFRPRNNNRMAHEDPATIKALLKELSRLLEPPSLESMSSLATSSYSVAGGSSCFVSTNVPPHLQHHLHVQQHRLRLLSSRVLYVLSERQFGAVFNRVSARLAELSVSGEERLEPPHMADLQLLAHVQLDSNRLGRLLHELHARYRTLRKPAQSAILHALERAIWNWLNTCPHELAELQNAPLSHPMVECVQRVFDMLDAHVDTSTKRRVGLWPIQLLLIVLSPKLVADALTIESSNQRYGSVSPSSGPIPSSAINPSASGTTLSSAVTSGSLLYSSSTASSTVSIGNAQSSSLTANQLLANTNSSATTLIGSSASTAIAAVANSAATSMNASLTVSTNPTGPISTISSSTFSSVVSSTSAGTASNSSTASSTSPNSSAARRRAFVESVRRALSSYSLGTGGSSRANAEAAALAAIKLCRFATYINALDGGQVVFTLLQQMLSDLRSVLLQSPRPLISQVEPLAEWLLSLFRLAPHDTNTVMQFCASPSAPLHLQLALVLSLQRAVIQPRLPWWPPAEQLHTLAPFLRLLFADALNRTTAQQPPHAALRTSHSLSLKDKVSGLRIRDREEPPTPRQLLLQLVRLVRVQPILLLQQPNDRSVESPQHSPSSQHHSTLDLINGLVSLVHQPVMAHDIAHEAMAALLVLHEPQHIHMWNPTAPMHTFWDASSQLLFSISQKLIQRQITDYTHVLKWLRELMRRRIAFLRRYPDAAAAVGSSSPISRQAHIKLEVVLFVHLWALDVDAVLLALGAFGELCEEAQVRTLGELSPGERNTATTSNPAEGSPTAAPVTANHPISITGKLPNHSVYMEFAAVGSQLPTGRAALQKRVMSILRKIRYCSTGCLQAWEDTFMVWEQATRSLITNCSKSKAETDIGSSEPLLTSAAMAGRLNAGKRRASHGGAEHDLEEQIHEWSHQTGFLCALGGVCLRRRQQTLAFNIAANAPDSNTSSTASSTANPSNNTSPIPSATSGTGPLPPLPEPSAYCPVTQFIGQLVRLLTTPTTNDRVGPAVQRHVKELVAHELSATLRPILFEQLKLQLDKLFDSQQQPILDDGHTQFVSHAIFVLRHVLDRRTSTNETIDASINLNESIDRLHKIDTIDVTLDGTIDSIKAAKQIDPINSIEPIEPIMLSIVRYVRQLDPTNQGVQLRTRFCSLVETIMIRRDELTFRHEIRFRNKMVEYLADWVLGSNTALPTNSASTNASGLDFNPPPPPPPLPPLPVPLHLELDQAAVQSIGSLLRGLPLQPDESDRADLMEAKSQLFLKHFSLFMNLLSGCAEVQAMAEHEMCSIASQLGLSLHSVAQILASGGGAQTLAAGIVGQYGGFNFTGSFPGPLSHSTYGFSPGSVSVSGAALLNNNSAASASLNNFNSSITNLSSFSSNKEFNARLMQCAQRAQKMADLRTATIQAMSNLLSANIDSGLTHALALGYHDDLQTRAAFMEVLTRILQQGTEFDMLAETVMADRYEQLIQLLTLRDAHGEFPITMALVSVVGSNQLDELARLLVPLFDSRQLLGSLLLSLFGREVDSCDTPQTLFRGNGLASKVMSVCFRLFGVTYLKRVLLPYLSVLLDLPTSAVAPTDHDALATTNHPVIGSPPPCAPHPLSLSFDRPASAGASSSTHPLLIEVDPARVSSDQLLQQNRKLLLQLAAKVLDSILKSGDQMPNQIRLVCCCLTHVLNRRCSAPNQTSGVLTVVLFLRFINPAIVAPSEFGLLDQPPPPTTRRSLMLLSKLLQNAANQVEFKEPHMQFFNDFLRDRFQSVRDWAASLVNPDLTVSLHPATNNTTATSATTSTSTSQSDSSVPTVSPVRSSSIATTTLPTVTSTGSSSAIAASTVVKEECGNSSSSGAACFVSHVHAVALHRLLWQHQQQMGEFLASSRDRRAAGRRPFDKLATLLAYLGPAEQRTPANVSAWPPALLGLGSSSCEFEQAMARQNVAERDEYKRLKAQHVFYQAGESRAGRPVFYYVARRFRTDETNGDLLVYHVLLTLKSFVGRPFELLLDCTHAGAEHRHRTELVKRWFVVLPPQAYEQLATVYILNCNTWVREYIKYHERTLAPLKNDRRIIFIDTPGRLNEFIAPDQLRLPSTTFALDQDVKVFSNALKLSHKDSKVTLKIGPSALQVQSAEKCKVLGHSVLLNDVYYASEIDEVCLVDDNQFTLAIAHEAGPLSFIHSDCDAIVQALVHIRTRWELSQAEHLAVHSKLRPKDVPGTLLNMALLNLGSTDAPLRSAAYNLLCALAQTFDLQLDGQLLHTPGLCIPSNNTIFIKQISETLAANASHLTLEFLDECAHGFGASSIQLKHLCLEYMTPWLPNLTRFCRHADDGKRQRVAALLDKLVSLTVTEVQMYPSIQAKIWGTVGRISDLLDLALDRFVQRSLAGGPGSPQAEIMADTTVALASGNVRLVAAKVIGRLCRVLERTCAAPTASLEQHLLWSDIAILLRFLLMLSFNNCLDVALHLPYLLHIVTMLSHTGPATLRASVHGLVVNVLHSLCTCTRISFDGDAARILRLSLDEFALPKFKSLFGVPTVTSASSAAASITATAQHRPLIGSCNFASPSATLSCCPPIAAFTGSPASSSGESISARMPLSSLETITDALLEVVECCARQLYDCAWLDQWTELARRFAFRHHPALQPRALIVFGCLARTATDHDLQQLLRVLLRALDAFQDVQLIDASVTGLARLQPLLPANSFTHIPLFWVAVCVLQLEDADLYASGLALLEQNLHTLDLFGTFDKRSLSSVLLNARDSLEWHFKQLDSSVGLSFRSHFHFALVGHLIKGFRHPSPATVARTVRVLHLLLDLIAKSTSHDRFEVTNDSIAYLTALLPVSDEVRTRFRLRPRTQSSAFAQCLSTPTQACSDELLLLLLPSQHGVVHPQPSSSSSTSSPACRGNSYCCKNSISLPANTSIAPNTTRRQKSWEILLDRTAITADHKSPNDPADEPNAKSWRSLDLEPSSTATTMSTTHHSAIMLNSLKSNGNRTLTMPLYNPTQFGTDLSIGCSLPDSDDPYVDSTPEPELVEPNLADSGSEIRSPIPIAELDSPETSGKPARCSLSADDYILLNPDVIRDEKTQALILTLWVSTFLFSALLSVLNS